MTYITIWNETRCHADFLLSSPHTSEGVTYTPPLNTWERKGQHSVGVLQLNPSFLSATLFLLFRPFQMPSTTNPFHLSSLLSCFKIKIPWKAHWRCSSTQKENIFCPGFTHRVLWCIMMQTLFCRVMCETDQTLGEDRSESKRTTSSLWSIHHKEFYHMWTDAYFTKFGENEGRSVRRVCCEPTNHISPSI